jgi:hypothetical protein
MKRLIITTTLLLAATIFVTVFYFRRLSASTQHTSLVLRTIPNDASLIVEFNNDKDFYDIFSGNKLFANIIGQDKMDELAALRKDLLQNSLMTPYLNGQNLYVSLHPQKGNTIDFLLTIAISKDFQPELLEKLSRQQKNGMVIAAINIGGKPGYSVYLNDVKRRFYLINKDEHTLSGSFSKDLIESCANYDYKTQPQAFVLMSDQQNSNSLANLYVNYKELSPLFEQLFINKNPDVFRTFRQLPAFAALSMNYKTDALMFNGTTEVQKVPDEGYLSIFRFQQPVVNQLKEIFPSTTAYYTNFGISDPEKFRSDLADRQMNTDFKTQRASVLNKVSNQTGVSLVKEFSKLLGNEFALVTTHYREKIAIIQTIDGSKMRALLINISRMNNDNSGQFNFDNIPQILLGEAFSTLKRPYFIMMDNYLVLANSPSELASYKDSYLNHKFLNKTDGYSQFSELPAERSNISFFIQFKNALQLFKEDMKPAFYNYFENIQPGWKNFYGASLQLTSSEKNYYTNFCMGLHSDTTSTQNTF